MVTKKCFVVMSFAERNDAAYGLGIKPAVMAAGYNCFRMDEDLSPKHIPVQLIRELLEADLIIVDVTDANPNVYYELGISHTIGNKTIIVTQSPDQLPFDLRGEFVIAYTADRNGWALLERHLGDAIRRLEARGAAATNLVQFAGRDYFDMRRQAEAAIAELNAERARLSEFREYLAKGRPLTSNTPVIEHLAGRIVARESSRGISFVSVCGAAGLGKSRFSQDLGAQLALVLGPGAAEVLSLDSFMMDRAERVENRVSGYDVRAHNLYLAQEALNLLVSGQQVQIRPYDHVLGSHGELRTVSPTRVIIIDGIHSLHEFIVPHICYGIFLTSSSADAKELRFIADVLDRCYVIRDAFAHADAEYRAFEEHVRGYSRLADAVVVTEGYWKYRILKS